MPFAAVKKLHQQNREADLRRLATTIRGLEVHAGGLRDLVAAISIAGIYCSKESGYLE